MSTDLPPNLKHLLLSAILYKIKTNPNIGKQSVMKESLDEFNKWFEGVYYVDSFELPAETIKYDSDDGRMIHA